MTDATTTSASYQYDERVVVNFWGRARVGRVVKTGESRGSYALRFDDADLPEGLCRRHFWFHVDEIGEGAGPPEVTS